MSVRSGFVAPKDYHINFLFLWAYFMIVIPETCRAHWIRYLCIYWKHTTILYVVHIFFFHTKLTI